MYSCAEGTLMQKSPYFLKYPCFIIENDDGCTIRCLSVDGNTCVALFTDENLVRRYLNQQAFSGTVRSFDNQDDLQAFLKSVLTHYDRFVQIDPNIGGQGYVGVAISDFLNQPVD